MEHDFIPYETHQAAPGRRIGILAPHPDDEVFGPGGALALWKSSVVSVAVVSDGMGWSQQENLEHIRQDESKSACQIMDWPEPEFWRYPDGGLLAARHALIEKIALWIENNKLECIFIPSVWEMHRDHRACAEAGLQAAYAAECLQSVWQYEIGRPLEKVNRLVDISATFCLKQHAMYCYPSQLKMQNYFEQICALNVYRTYTLPKTVCAAEAFFALQQSDVGDFLEKNNPLKQETTKSKICEAAPPILDTELNGRKIKTGFLDLIKLRIKRSLRFN